MLSTSIVLRSMKLASKSPRAPQLDLESSLAKAFELYEQEQLAEVPLDIVAQNLGYKNANNGAAMSVFATLRYYGLVERSSPGKLRVSKDVQRYKHAPDEQMRARLRVEWLAKPPVFADLLERYQEGLPSDATIRYHLIDDLGFRPAMAETVLDVFKRSISFAGVGGRIDPTVDEGADGPRPEPAADEAPSPSKPVPPPPHRPASGPRDHPPLVPDGYETIPVRLSGGRRALISLPERFYEADKKILKDQIDLVLASES